MALLPEFLRFAAFRGLRPHALGYFFDAEKVTKKAHKGGTLSMGSLPYGSLLRDDTKGGARRHKLRIPHPAASGRLRSLRCASFFLGKRPAGLPRIGPCGAVFATLATVSLFGEGPKPRIDAEPLPTRVA